MIEPEVYLESILHFAIDFQKMIFPLILEYLRSKI